MIHFYVLFSAHLGEISTQPYFMLKCSTLSMFTVLVIMYKIATCITNVWGCAKILPRFVLRYYYLTKFIVYIFLFKSNVLVLCKWFLKDAILKFKTKCTWLLCIPVVICRTSGKNSVN